MIEVIQLTKSYGSKRVLEDLNLYIPKGKVTALTGPNGSGKTTLLKCLLGMVMPDSGSIRIDGRLIGSDGEFRKDISYMPQNADFPANLTLNEILNMICELRDRHPEARRELASFFGIGPFLNQSFGKLSGGTKQKFATVLACMFDSPLLIMDEPTAGLDPHSRVKFKDLLLRKKREGKTVLMVSHLMSEVQQVADRLVLLDEGKRVFQGEVAEILARSGQHDLDRALTSLLTENAGERDELKIKTLA